MSYVRMGDRHIRCRCWLAEFEGGKNYLAVCSMVSYLWSVVDTGQLQEAGRVFRLQLSYMHDLYAC